MKIINLSHLSFDIDKADEWKDKQILSEEGELARLFIEIKGHSQITTTKEGITSTIPERKGIDISIATFQEIKLFLDDNTIKKSESIRQLCRKIMALRFQDDFNKEINKVSNHLKQEYQLIQNENTNIKSLGQCGGGVFGEVRLDGSTKTIKRILSFKRKI